jgi:ketosteroid isomerase-like protein
MATKDRLQIVRDNYAAFQSGDRAAVEEILAPG